MDFMKPSESGVDPAGLAEAPKLLSSASRAMEALAAEIQLRRPMAGRKVAAELQELRSYILQIWAVLLSAGDRALLREARDAAYGVEDVQGMLHYRDRANLGRHRLLSALVSWKRLTGLSSSVPTKLLKDIQFVTQEARRLAHLLAGAAGSPDPGTEPPHTGVLPHRRHTVFGRDKERDEVVRMLIEPMPEMFVSIVGAQGVGKTTLAQMVFNDERVGQHFDVTRWVSVSTGSTKTELAAEIPRSAQQAWDGSVDKMVDFHMLQSELLQFLASKRYLIVLDDVCNTALITSGRTSSLLYALLILRAEFWSPLTSTLGNLVKRRENTLFAVGSP